MYFSLAVTSMRAELPFGKVPTTLVPLLISRLTRLIPLFVLIRRQGSVEKVGVASDPKRVGPASRNLEHS